MIHGKGREVLFFVGTIRVLIFLLKGVEDYRPVEGQVPNWI